MTTDSPIRAGAAFMALVRTDPEFRRAADSVKLLGHSIREVARRMPRVPTLADTFRAVADACPSVRLADRTGIATVLAHLNHHEV